MGTWRTRGTRGEQPARIWRRAARTGSATWCWWGRAGSGKTTLVETLLAASGAVPRAGSVRRGQHGLRLRGVRAGARPLGLARRRAAGARRHQGQPRRHPRVRRLRRRAARRAAGCGLRALRGGRQRGGRRRAPAPCGASAPTWACRARWSSPSSTRRAPTTRACSARPRRPSGTRWSRSYVPQRSGEQVVALTGLLAPDGDAAGGPARRADRGVIEESEDETLMDRYVGGEEIAEDVLIADLERAVARATFFPVVPVCATRRASAAASSSTCASAASPPRPSTPRPRSSPPRARPRPPLTCDPDGPLVAEVVKTTSDPYVGRVSLVRVFSGTLLPDQPVHVSGHFTSFFGDELGPRGPRRGRAGRRAGAPLRPAPRSRRPAIVAGDLCAVGRLTRAETGDTLSARRRPAGAAAVVDARAAAARSRSSRTASADEDKLSTGPGAGSRAEDPTLRIENNAETHQLVLWCMGEAHAERAAGAAHRPLRRDRRPGAVHGVAAGDLRRDPRRATGGTSSSPAATASTRSATSRWSRCPRASGFEFVDKVVGGAVPRQFIPSVEKGVRAQMERGVRHGLPGRRPPGDAHRRQGAQRRLLRHGLPDRGRAGAARGRGVDDHHHARAVRHGHRASSPTTSWAA